MSNSINCIVVIAFVKILLCSRPVASDIDGFIQDYLDVEKNLWHLVRTTNVQNNDNSLLHIYEEHAGFLGNNFGETGIIDALSKQQRNITDENRMMERHIRHIIDGIQHINITALNTQRILNNNQYEYLPNVMRDIEQNMPNMIATLCKYIDSKFWSFIKNVNRLPFYLFAACLFDHFK